MAKHNHILDTVDECITNGVNNKVLHLSSGGGYADGRTLIVNGENLVHFASYSYLGLETDQRLKDAGIEAIQKYGTQYGCSRAYVSIELYEELENLFAQIFQAPVLIAPSTTLAHIAAIPVLIRDEDAVIIDQHVHSSVQMTIKLLKVRGIPVEILRHNRLDMLEDRIKELRQKHRRVWYLLDGVYSMYGDFAPLQPLYELMNKYEQFSIYVDDAHGMSWQGERGSGYAISQIPLHPQMILITSLNKAFASSGGAIVFPDKELYRKVRTCGGTLIFSTPIQPPMLGVGIASAKIHLSPEIITLQKSLAQRIELCKTLLIKHQIPVIANNDSPIFYVGTGLPKVAYNIAKRMMNDGFYTSVALFPAVSMKCAGIRFCINLHHTTEDIQQMIGLMAHHYPLAIEEEGRTYKDVYQAFKMDVAVEQLKLVEPEIKNAKPSVERYQTIKEINKEEWNSLLGYNGSFDWDGLLFMENVFRGNDKKENNWDFYYFIIRDNSNKPILATFFTVAWCKDDIFSPATVSEQIEQQRLIDPYYLCSKVLMMGSLLTEGTHLYLDKKHAKWQDALILLLDQATQLQNEVEATSINLRDFDTEDIQMNDLMTGEGFVKVDLPDAHVFDNLKWNTTEEYISCISSKSKKHVKKYIIPYEKFYEISFLNSVSEKELDHLYWLYTNVKNKGHELNTFLLPKKLFRKIIGHPNWEVMQLTLKEEYNDRPERKPIAVMFSYKTDKSYSPIIVGLDYFYLFAYKNYRQILFQTLKRAAQLKLEKIHLGFTASIEKQRLGATPQAKVAYVQTSDSYNMEVLENHQQRGTERAKVFTQFSENSKVLKEDNSLD
jgi:7-keto-8-aminopelargonate synthetase-like enzyme